MYVSALINGQAIRVLLNTGAMYNFISEDEAKHLGLKATQSGGTIRAVNSPLRHLREPHEAYMLCLGHGIGARLLDSVDGRLRNDPWHGVLRQGPCLPNTGHELLKYL